MILYSQQLVVNQLLNRAVRCLPATFFLFGFPFQLQKTIYYFVILNLQDMIEMLFNLFVEVVMGGVSPK